MTINDIDDGLNKLINFYIKKAKVYSLKNVDRKLMHKFKDVKKHSMKNVAKKYLVNPKYKYERKVTLRRILKNKKKYYIPCLLQKEENTFSNKSITLSEIHSFLPLINLEKDFLSEIKDLIPYDRNVKITTSYSRPKLRFEDSRVIDISLNIDLPLEEIISYISKIKKDYNEKHHFRNTKELLNKIYREDTIEHTIDLKKNIEDAFFCYDYFTKRKDYISQENREIKEKNENNIDLCELKSELELIENTDYVDNKTKKINKLKEEIKKLTINSLQININKDSKNYIFNENNFKISGINPHTAYKYYRLIAPYINELRYKDLIIGKKIM